MEKINQIKKILDGYRRKLFNILEYLGKYIFQHRIFLAIFMIFFYLWFNDPPLPNILGIEAASSAITLLSTIAGALSAILAIVVAIVLVAFEILRRVYSTHAFDDFFKSEYLRLIIELYVSAIIVSMLTIVHLDINLIYFSLFLFIVSILILFPYAQKIIASTISKERINDLIRQINYSKVVPVGHADRMPPSENVSLLEKNPIFILSEVSARTIRDNDHLTPKLINVEATRRLLEMLRSGKNNRRTIIKAFLLIYRNTANHATRLHQEGTVETVLDCIERVHDFCAENKFSWNEMIELNEALSNILDDCIKVGLDEIVIMGIYRIGRIMEKHLKDNVPPENEIWDLQIKIGKDVPADTKKALQWKYASHEYLGMISGFLESAIELKRGAIINAGLSGLVDIAANVVSGELGDLQKDVIVGLSNYYIKTCALKSADKGLQQQVMGLSPFRSYYIDAALCKKAVYSKDPLIKFDDFLIQLAQKGVFDTSLLNELGTTGRGTVDKIDEDKIFKEALIYIIDVFSRLREILEVDMSGGKELFYVELHNQVESLKKWMASKKKKDEGVEEKLNETLSKFDKLIEIKSELEAGKIKWPEISGGG